MGMSVFKNKGALLLLMLLSVYTTVCAESRALLVGIGNYDQSRTGWRKIHGDADVSLLAPVLKERGFTVRSLVNEKATKKNIIKALTQLAKESTPGDKVYFHFSGHGQRVPDLNGDEADGFDEVIIPYDALRSPGYATVPLIYNGENHIIDDELAILFEGIREKLGSGGELFAVFDACYSSGIEKGGEEEFMDELTTETESFYIRGTSDYFTPTDNSYIMQLPLPQDFKPGCLTAIIAASLENERNFEVNINGNYYGALSYCIYKLLKNDVPLSDWIPYFKTGKYRRSGFFKSFQHPSITVIK